MPDKPDDKPVPKAAAAKPLATKPDAPPEQAERAMVDHGGFSDTDGEGALLTSDDGVE